MSSAWSWYVMILVVLNIGGCLLLLWWTSRRRGGGEDPSGTTGHVWDGNLREYTKPMPRWWIIWFYLTIVFAIGYLIWFPGFGNFAGPSGWTSAREHDAAVAQAQAKLAPLYARFEGQPIDRIAADAEGVALGKSIFANTCAACHGSDARGSKGFPNLTDADWLGGDGGLDYIVKTIAEGRQRPDDFDHARRLITSTRALDDTFACARRYAARAKEDLARAPHNPYAETLGELATFSAQRTS